MSVFAFHPSHGKRHQRGQKPGVRVVSPLPAVAVAAAATLGLAATSPAHADFLFDFNSLSDGASNSSVESYMNGVLTHGIVTLPYKTSGCTTSNPCTGAVGERNYSGDGHVVGIATTDSSLPMWGQSSWGKGVVPITLGNTDGVGTSNEVQHLSTLDTYITNKQNVTSQFNMVFSNPGDPDDPLRITQISFDFQIFPEAANSPDLTFKFKDNEGNVHTVAYLKGVDPNGRSPADWTEHNKQLIGHLDVSTEDFCGPECYATELAFIDWPSVIGVDNLYLGEQPPPPPRNNAPEPMTGALLLSGLGGLWLARRRRHTADA
jgi:MYXO-CTERM domain-containing protein